MNEYLLVDSRIYFRMKIIRVLIAAWLNSFHIGRDDVPLNRSAIEFVLSSSRTVHCAIHKNLLLIITSVLFTQFYECVPGYRQCRM